MAEDYDLVSHKVVSGLKKDIDDLKANPLGGTGSGKDLLNSMEGLSHNLNMMSGLFKDAAESLKLEEKEEEVLAKKIDPMNEKLDMIITQNKQIAEGIVAIADMIQERFGSEKIVESKPKPVQSPMNMGMPPSVPPMPGEMPPPAQPTPPPIGGNIEGKVSAPKGLGPIPPTGAMPLTGAPSGMPGNMPPLGGGPLPPLNKPEKKGKKSGMFGSLFK